MNIFKCFSVHKENMNFRLFHKVERLSNKKNIIRRPVVNQGRLNGIRDRENSIAKFKKSSVGKSRASFYLFFDIPSESPFQEILI